MLTYCVILVLKSAFMYLLISILMPIVIVVLKVLFASFSVATELSLMIGQSKTFQTYPHISYNPMLTTVVQNMV